MKQPLITLPVLVVMLLGCDNGQQQQVIEQQRIQDSIEQARLDSIEQVRKDSLEQMRRDSLENVAVSEKIDFLKQTLYDYDHDFNPEKLKKHLSKQALKQLWRKDRIFDDEYSYDWGYFQDGGQQADGSDGDYNPVVSRIVTQAEGNWFKVRTIFEDNMPRPTTFQVMVEDVDGKYMITKLKIR